MAEHTPGPWMLATGSSWRRIMSERNEMVCEPITSGHDRHPDLHFRNGGEDGPDARLIVAAPDLLEAAKEARREIAWLMDQVKARPNGSVDKAFRKLNAAIAKATNTEPTTNPVERGTER